MKNAVVITQAPKVNYMYNYVKLPYYYGSERYYSRPDVKAICETVAESLNRLEEATGFQKKFHSRKVYVKPNLVMPNNRSGYVLENIPQTTDPRVFDAVILYLKKLDCDISIIESSGKPQPTCASFKALGYDRIAKHHGIGLIPLDEQPIDHFYAPKAEVQKDVYLPRPISEVVEGKALYVSVPKMKTNCYTGVTLGFKNAMGVLPGNMRYRNHNYSIEAKLVDLLYLFQPDLTVIDGIIGGEGLTPGPVDPVKVGMIVTGTNSVEVDRVVTRMMGFDPDTLQLTKEAAKRGFGDSAVEIIGEERIVPFRSAESTFLSKRFRRNWPEVRYFVGFSGSRAPKVEDIHAVTPEMVYEIEGTCRGGCLATMAYHMEMLNKAKKRPDSRDVRFGAVLGNGVEVDGKRYWFDADGKPYDLEALKEEAKKVPHMVGFGACTASAYEACDITGGGCCNVGEIMHIFMLGCRHLIPPLSLDNDSAQILLAGTLRRYFSRRRLIKSGQRYDIPYDAKEDRFYDIPQLSEEDMAKDWIKVPMPEMTAEEKKQALKQVFREMTMKE